MAIVEDFQRSNFYFVFTGRAKIEYYTDGYTE